jgi:hypothetical protein
VRTSEPDVFFRRILPDRRELIVVRSGELDASALRGLVGGPMKYEQPATPGQPVVVNIPEPTSVRLYNVALELHDSTGGSLVLWSTWIHGSKNAANNFAVLDMITEPNRISMVVVREGAVELWTIGLAGVSPHPEMRRLTGWMGTEVLRPAIPKDLHATLARDDQGELVVTITDTVVTPPHVSVYRFKDEWQFFISRPDHAAR